jgi:hypothetical protein
MPMQSRWDRLLNKMSVISYIKRLFSPSGLRDQSAGFSLVNQATRSTEHIPTAAQSIPESSYAFLSYSHKDQGVVSQFAGYLAQEEIPPWVDNQLEYGESWEDVIFRRIEGCKVFLILMSPGASESVFVNREIDTALRLDKLIIPIRIAGEPFPKLQSYQFVDLLDTDNGPRFIERLRDLLTPGKVPSPQVQRRHLEHFILPVFEEALEVGQGCSVDIGIGFDRHFAVQPQQSLKGELDELNWMEILMNIRERLPARDLHCPLGTDFDARFPTIQTFIDFLMDTLTWDEIRRL